MGEPLTIHGAFAPPLSREPPRPVTIQGSVTRPDGETMNRILILCACVVSGILSQVATAQQLASIDEPQQPAGFKPAPIDVPDGFSVELAAGPPLVTHPTMACFDDQGRLYVCNNAGVNMTNDQLEQHRPNTIRRLVDADGDGRFDSFTVFADKMTFPMGGVWKNGSLFVASPPNIWKLTDTDDDGVADERKIIVDKFGFNGNAASIHGCFAGPDGRIYWTDGYHGHEFKDHLGNVTSKREGSYIFSCRPDGSDTRIHCGGGMDNPVEVDFTDSGDMLGTVNILYTRPRIDCLVHWLYGGAYPHREKVLREIKVTGDLLGPVHRFGHVAVSGMTRYRSGTIDHRWGDDLFATFFNGGKVVRLSLARQGSTYTATQHEFLSSSSREFHPTDVLEDADGSLLVVDTGGWFYRGCPTSQFSKPELLGGIYRIRREGMTAMVDPRGIRIDWQAQTPAALVELFDDARFAVRERAIAECVSRGQQAIPTLNTMASRGDVRARRNSVWALTRMAQNPALSEDATAALRAPLKDAIADIRQAACRGMSLSSASVETAWITPLLQDEDAGVRRQAATTLGVLGNAAAIPELVEAVDRSGIDRSEEHSIIYAMIEIGDPAAIRQAMSARFITDGLRSAQSTRGALVALDQIEGGNPKFVEIMLGFASHDPLTRRIAAQVAKRRSELQPQVSELIRDSLQSDNVAEDQDILESLLPTFIHQESVAAAAGAILKSEHPEETKMLITRAISQAGNLPPHQSWIDPLGQQLSSRDETLVSQAIAAVASLPGREFDDRLNEIAADSTRPMAIRMDALSALALQSGSLDDRLLLRLIDLIQHSGSPTAAARASQIIGAAQLTTRQRLRVAPLLSNASPTELRELLRVFQRQVKPQVATAFLDSIESARSLMLLTEIEFSEVIKRFPRETLGRANAVLDQLKRHQQQKLKRLESLRSRLANGDAKRGQAVFMSEKSKCSSCHRVAKQGIRVGPDLTTIGANRSAGDLLESLVFPSASIVRDYESYQVLTVDGRAMTGLLVGESSGTIEIQQASGEKVLLRQDDIEQIETSAVSIMPAGLDEALTETELLDVVKYLQSLK